jgi:DnaJ-class molecular chaperone
VGDLAGEPVCRYCKGTGLVAEISATRIVAWSDWQKEQTPESLRGIGSLIQAKKCPLCEGEGKRQPRFLSLSVVQKIIEHCAEIVGRGDIHELPLNDGCKCDDDNDEEGQTRCQAYAALMKYSKIFTEKFEWMP